MNLRRAALKWRYSVSSWKMPLRRITSVGLAAIALIVSVALLLPDVTSADATGTVITEFDAGFNPGAQPEDLVAGPDGNFWFTDRNQFYPEPPAPPAIGRITPSGEITEFSEGLDPDGRPVDITVGPDGNLWFADARAPAIGRITPSGQIIEYTSGLPSSTAPREIISGPDGNLWFSAGGGSPGIGWVTVDGAITRLALPGTPGALVVGPDNNVWFTSEAPSAAIGRVQRHEDNTTTITLFSAGLQPDSNPKDIISGPDGNLWFSDPGETLPAVGRITPSGVITEFNQGLLPDSEPGELLLGPDGDIWFADWKSAIGRITTSGTISEYETPSESISTPLGIAFGPEGDLWYTDYNAPAIGRVTQSGRITEYWLGLHLRRPQTIVTGPEGNLWFTDSNAPLIGRIVPGNDSPGDGVANRLQQHTSPSFVAPRRPVRRSAVRLRQRLITVRRGRAIMQFRCMAAVRCRGRLVTFGRFAVRRKGRVVMLRRLAFHGRYSVPPGAVKAVWSQRLRPGVLRQLRSRRKPLWGVLKVKERAPFLLRPWRRKIRLTDVWYSPPSRRQRDS